MKEIARSSPIQNHTASRAGLAEGNGLLGVSQSNNGLKNSIDISASYSSIRRRIVTSIFYKRDAWEINSNGRAFYDRMVTLAARGIPNVLR